MLTPQQFSTLSNTLTGAIYTSMASSGNYNGILAALNAPYDTGTHYLQRTVLKNILATNGVYNMLLIASMNPSSPMYEDAVIAIHNLDSSDYPTFTLENPQIQTMIGALVTAGVMTSGAVAELEAQFIPNTSTIAMDILGGAATLDDITQVLGAPLVAAAQAAISYAQTYSQSILTPLQDALNQKQAQISSYMNTLQTTLSTLQSGNPSSVPTQAEIQAALS